MTNQSYNLSMLIVLYKFDYYYHCTHTGYTSVYLKYFYLNIYMYSYVYYLLTTAVTCDFG